jgi:hypothetical protein
MRKWALAWLQKIRQLYEYQRERLQAEVGSDSLATAETNVRHTIATL